MSGGTAVKTESHGGGAGAGKAEPRPMTFARRQSEGLGLDGGRGRRPQREKESQPIRAVQSCARDRSRMAETDEGGLGSREPGPAKPDASLAQDRPRKSR